MKPPAGTFFRVSESVALPSAMKVELRELRRYFGSRVLHETYVYPGDYVSGEAAVEAGKARVARMREQRLADTAKYRAATKLTGDHK